MMKEESEKGSYKGQRQISTHDNYGELPTSRYSFEPWQSIFLDILINFLPSHFLYIPIAINRNN